MHQMLNGIQNIRGMEIWAVMGEAVREWLWGHHEGCLCTGRPRSYEREYAFVPDRKIWRTEVASISELMREKQLLQTTLQSRGDGVITKDEAGLIWGMNQVAEELTEWTSEAAAGPL